MTPFSGPAYQENAKRCAVTHKTPCAYCGKAVKDESNAPRVRVLKGGSEFATAENLPPSSSSDEGDEESSLGDMGWFPVGPECAKRLRSAGVYLAF